MTLRLPRIYPRRLALVVMILMCSSAIYFLPGMSIPTEGWNVLCFLYLVFFYLGWKAKRGEKFLGFEIYILVMMALIPLWAGIMADHNFGQPLIYGALTQRTMILGTGGLAILTFYRLGWIDTEDLKGAFRILAWLMLFLYTLYMIATHNQEEIQASGGAVRLNYAFIEIGFFYYGLIGFNKKSKLHYALASLFLIYVILSGKRALLLSMLGAYGLFVLLRGSFSRLAIFVPASLFAAIALLGVLYVANAQYVTNLGVRIAAAFTVVTTGQKTSSASANARIEEIAVAIPYITNTWLLGNGNISHRWHGGTMSVLQAYFFPGDIGIFGVVFMFGVLGMLTFVVQFWWAWKYGTAASAGRQTDPMVDAVLAFLISYFVQSLEGGLFAFAWPVGIMLIAYLYLEMEKRKGLSPLRRRLARYPSGDLFGLQPPR